jgi:hypothetical protein
MTQINSSQDLFNYLAIQATSGNKNWFGFQQQRLAGIHLAYEIGKIHADKLSPDEVVNYVIGLNNAIYSKMIKNGEGRDL